MNSALVRRPPPTAGGRVRAITDYSSVMVEVQARDLLQRRYRYYAVKISLTFLALGGVGVTFAFVGNSWTQIATAAALAVVVTQIVFLSHDAAHRQIFRSNAANENLALIMGVLFGGVSLAWWHNKHNRHHAAPNQIGKDPDITPSVVHFYPPGRAPRSKIVNFLHQRQGWWFFPLLIVEALNLHVQSVQALITQPAMKRRRLEMLMLVTRLIGYPAALFLLLPPGKAGAFLGVQLAVTGLYLGTSFAASHIGMPVLDHDLRIDFFRRQVLTSRNIRGGRLASWLMGGLNLQIEHHLFPNAPGPSLRHIRPLVRAHCIAHDVPYPEMSIVKAWALVAGHLNRVGLRSSTFQCPVVAALRSY